MYCGYPYPYGGCNCNPIPLSQLCCYENCSRNPPPPPGTGTGTGTGSVGSRPDSGTGTGSVGSRPTASTAPPVRQQDPPITEDDTFADSMEPTDEIMDGDFEEDVLLPMAEEGTMTPLASYSNMKSTGTTQKPIGSPIPWDGNMLPWRGKSKEDLCKMFFPEGNGNLIGLHDLYNELKPFSDESAPTVSEIEYWNLEVLRFFRRLIGNTAPFNYKKELFIQGRWADERKYSNQWDASYTSGKCPQGSGAHCGWLFLPNCMDQQSYLDQYPEAECITKTGGHSEGIAGVPNSVPWANKLAYAIKAFLCQDGHKYHMGPIFGEEFGSTPYKGSRTTVGLSFWDKGNGSTSVRFKWGNKI